MNAPEASAFLPNDAYYERGFIRDVPGLHPAVRFVYRPMDIRKVGRMETVFAKEKDQSKVYIQQATTIVDQKHLIEWDVKDAKGAVLPITVDNLMRIKPMIFIGICAVIMGRGPSDAEDDAPHLANEIDRDAQAFIGGEEHPGGTDAKNSDAG
jgi:hypothetical protein